MLSHGNERLNIVLQLTNRFSYAEFKSSCEKANVLPLQPMVYAQKVGMLSCAESSYPELSPDEAYTLFIADNPYVTEVINAQPPSVQTVHNVPQRGCGSCGGGKVK